MGLGTCQLDNNVLAQLVTPSLSITKLATCMGCIQETDLVDVTYWVREKCITIRVPTEEGHPQPPVFA